MALSFSIIALFSVILSIGAIFLAIYILQRVYQEEYKRPWLFIGIASVTLGLTELLRFANGFFGIRLGTQLITDVALYLMSFIAILLVTYGLLLEALILKFYKGKFVKMKLLPVQEGTLGGELDINVSKGSSYLAVKKDKKFLLEQFAQATKKGFEGFLIGEDSPKEVRVNFEIQKTPIAWVSQIENVQSEYAKQALDENSEIVDPLQVNNIVSYIDNFLDKSVSPFVMLQIDSIMKVNNQSIVIELLKYLEAKIKKFDGIMIVTINTDVMKKEDIADLKHFLVELE